MTALLCLLSLASIGSPPPSSAAPAGRREEKGGWVILHLSGSPRQVGFQHGSLAAKEVEGSVKVFAFAANESSYNWDWYKKTAHKMFWDKLDPEYRDEMEGIAEGAASKGVKVTADDILALNAYIELSDYYVPVMEAKEHHAEIISRAPLACSAFVATGRSTKDGKVVMGHNFWWNYLTGEHWNVVLDIKPTHGNHVMMDAVAGFIESATDWAINSKGICLCETTISGFTGFDENALPEFERMRKAIQYGNSLDDVAHIFKVGNNGGYANTWLLADTKTNEIGKLELGLKNVIFSSSNDGFYFGANFPEDKKLIREETPSYREYTGSNDTRIKRWTKHLDEDRGKIDEIVAEGYMADSYDSRNQTQDGNGGALCGKGGYGGAINGKVLTADSVNRMEFWGRMGIPDGSDLVVSKLNYDDKAKQIMFDLKGEPWTLISGDK